MSERAACVTGSLPLEERNHATHVIVHSVQDEFFHDGVKSLKKDKEVKHASQPETSVTIWNPANWRSIAGSSGTLL